MAGTANIFCMNCGAFLRSEPTEGETRKKLRSHESPFICIQHLNERLKALEERLEMKSGK